MGCENRDREKERGGGGCKRGGESPSRPSTLDSPTLDAENNSFAVKT